ncbi:hypothetical protein J6590_096559 [Homalodisca vitripennis]|nr:hypothetical protein J6590_096559 [Homalodisca vitripennis]
MASVLSNTLFGSDRNRHRVENGGTVASHGIAGDGRFRGGFARRENDGSGQRIHPGPIKTSPTLSVVGDLGPATPVPSSFSNVFGGYNRRTATDRELIRWNVVKEQDAQRGFRVFDGVLVSVKYVSSEDLFLERMQIAYSAYDAYVAGLVNGSPLDIAKAMVRAVSACLTRYFSTQSMLRTNRPFIAKVLNLESPDLFCMHSDFLQAFLFTNASPEDEVVISLAEKVYAENNFDVCGDYADPNTPETHVNRAQYTDQQLFDLVARLAERRVLGGTRPSFTSRHDSGASPTFTSLHDNTLFQQPLKEGAGEGANAMLILVTDLDALHNYVAYVLYLTPAQLHRRYNVNFDCLRRPTSSAGLSCCLAREPRKRKRDNTKVAISTVIEKKRRDKIDSMGERSTACDAALERRAVQTIERNNDLLCHVLLMLFDKCVTTLIDRGFENLNARRGYAVNSAKEIGAATIYTGIIDTVGEVSTNLEGYTFETVAKHEAKSNATGNQSRECHLRFNSPPDSVSTSPAGDGVRSAHEHRDRDTRYE